MADEERGSSGWETTRRAVMRASIRAFDLSERTAKAGWRSQQRRYQRWQNRLFMILQVSLAAGTSWGISHYLLGHPAPFLATVTTIICLGASFGQRLGRVLEVVVGVSLGVALGDVFVRFFGAGVWQLMLVIFVAMSIATWLGARALMVNQSAVQAATVLTIFPGFDAGVTRWQDALVGCAVALAFATIAPTAPINKPRLLAAKALHEASASIRAIVEALHAGSLDQAERILERTRATEAEMAELTSASNEGVAVVRTSPFLRRHRSSALQLSDLVVPLSRFIRNLRVLARRATIAAYRGEEVSNEFLDLLNAFAQVVDDCASDLFAGRLPEGRVPALKELAEQTSRLALPHSLSAAVLLAQLRSMVVDLMELCGVNYTDAREALPDLD